jgi:hypothetical protein
MIFAWNISQFPVHATIYGEDLTIEIDDVAVMNQADRSSERARKRLKLSKPRIVRSGAGADLVDMFFKVLLYGSILGSHRLEPAYQN